MFDWPRLRHFLGNLSLIVIPFLSMAFALAVLTETLTQEGELPALFRSLDFWLAVGLDMLPMIVAMVLVLWFAGRFLKTVYCLDGWRQGMAFLLRSRCGLRQFRPSVRIQKGGFDEGGAEVLQKIGGPGHLVIYHDSAVVLEQGGRLSRVAGVGIVPLERFEKVYNIIDLRPQRGFCTVEAMTRDGIPVSWNVEIQYQIDAGGIAATDEMPYPMSERHVLRAATSKWVRKSGESDILDWKGQLVDVEVDRHLRTILSCRRLDQLIGLTEDQDTARESIRTELEARLRDAAPRTAARILSVRLGNLRVDDAVTHEWVKAWKANWQNWSAKRLAHAEASYIHQYEIAKAEAQMQMIAQLAEALQKQLASRTISAQAVPQMVLMRLFSVLDRADFAPSSRVFFPTKTMDALEGIQRALSPGPSTDMASVILSASPSVIPVNGQATLEATVRDSNNNEAPDGTPVHFSTTLGSVSPTPFLTQSGLAVSILLADGQAGTAVVTAWSGMASGTTTIQIG